MAAHNYVPLVDQPISMGNLQQLAPISVDIPVDVSTDTFGGSAELWTSPAQLNCHNIAGFDYTYADWLFAGEGPLDIPATIDGETVLAVALHVRANCTLDGYNTGGPDDAAIVDPENCHVLVDQTFFPPGESLWTMNVDDTEVVRIPTTGLTITGGSPGPFFGTLILPEYERVLAEGSNWFVNRDPFHALPFAVFGLDHQLFWGPTAAGESFPDVFSINVQFHTVQDGVVVTPHIEGSSPSSSFQDAELRDAEVTVDVYPFIERGAPGDTNLMMVV